MKIELSILRIHPIKCIMSLLIQAVQAAHGVFQ